MSTNGIIARATGVGTFEGRYHHWDSYPSGLGVELVKLYGGHFKCDLKYMLQVLLDEHTGWSTIVHKDFNLKPGYKTPSSRGEMSIEEFYKLPSQRKPQCYCHGERHEEGWVATDTTDCGAEWAYVFYEDATLQILERGRHAGASEGFWNPVATINLDSDEEINWTAIECGENFERCSHYAWYHDLAPKTCNLGTRAFLGYKPLEFHDVVAVLINGKRYKLTGSGGHSDFLRRFSKQDFPRDTWVATVVAGNGKRSEKAIAHITQGGYSPMEGVTWVYPTTKLIKVETTVKAEAAK